MSKQDAVVVVESSGFSDKKIKMDGLKNAEGITISGDSLSAYFDRSFIDELTDDITKEARQDIGINHKPRLRYKPYKEKPGLGKLLSRSDINLIYSGDIMQNLVKINAPQIKFVIAALLSGESFTYDYMHEYIKEKCGKVIKLQPLQACVSVLKNSPAGFIFEKVGTIPATWRVHPLCSGMSPQDVYELTKKSGELTLEKAIRKYPFLADVLEEKTGSPIPLPSSIKEEETPKKTKSQQPSEQDSNDIQTLPAHAQPLVELIKSSGGKFDINVNVNFRILLGKP